MGFITGNEKKKDDSEGKKRVLEEVKKLFRPEFLNRIDELIVFSSLNDEELKQIVAIMLADVSKRLGENEIALEVSEKAKEELIKEGLDITYGARPLRRAIQKLVEDEIAEMMLRRGIGAGDTVSIDADEAGKLTFAKKN